MLIVENENKFKKSNFYVRLRNVSLNYVWRY